MSRARVRRWLTTAVAVVFAVCWLGTSPAQAHTALQRSTPAEGATLDRLPSSVVLTFTEDLVAAPGATLIDVTGSAGQSLVAAPPGVDGRTVTQALTGKPAGPVTVRWKVVAGDGHPLTGEFAFTVTTPALAPAPSVRPSAEPSVPPTAEPSVQPSLETSPPAALEPAPVTSALVLALDILLYLGALAFAGTTTFEAAIARRRVRGLAGTRIAAGVLAVASATLLLPFSALELLLLEPPALLRPDVWAPAVLWPTLVVALLAWVGVAGTLLATPPGRPASPGTALLAAAVAVGPALTGHSGILEPAVLRWVDALHLVAAAVWVGGLLGLLALLVPHGPGRLPDDPVEAAGILERFSRWALATVVVLATSGLAVALGSIGSLDALLGTPWGRTLLVKLSFVAVAVGIAGFNRFRVVPAIRRAPSDAAAWRSLRRYAGWEALVLVAVVVVTGVLTNTDSGLHAGH